ncbi:MAG: ParB/RepB/Spo0J family partition protein [Phycisphaerales bacterium]
MATSDDRGRTPPSRLGRGLGALIPVPVARPAAAPAATPPTAPTAGSGSGRGTDQAIANAAPVAVETKPKAVSPAPAPAVAAAVAAPVELASGGERVQFLPIQALRPGKYQPRGSMDPQALDALARSIETSGLMQPVVVRRVPGSTGEYELIAGERRWRAMQRLQRTEVPAIVREASDQDAAELSLIENLQREDLNPMDRAGALRRLADEFGLTHQQLAERVGIDRASVTNLLRLNELDSHSATLVRGGTLGLGHAKVLLGVADLAARRQLADQVVAHEWSVRQLESAASEHRKVPRGTSRGKDREARSSAHLTNLQRALEAHLGTRVQLRLGRSKGSGELRIQFFTLDEFDGLMQRIGFEGTDRLTV